MNMAEVLHQDADLQSTFDAAIADKELRAQQAQRDRIDGAMPSWLAFVIRPLAVSARSQRQRRFQRQGRGGENLLTAALRWRLDRTWTLCPDVVVQASDKEIAQIDLLAVGASSVFILEVKTWKGTIRATGLRWERRIGGQWKVVGSPARQQDIHVKRFRRWLDQRGIAIEPSALQAGIVMMQSEWLRTRDVPFPVFDRPSAVARWMKTQDERGAPLDAGVRQALLSHLITGGPPGMQG
jgi:hypothetical protein